MYRYLSYSEFLESTRVYILYFLNVQEKYKYKYK